MSKENKELPALLAMGSILFEGLVKKAQARRGVRYGLAVIEAAEVAAEIARDETVSKEMQLAALAALTYAADRWFGGPHFGSDHEST